MKLLFIYPNDRKASQFRSILRDFVHQVEWKQSINEGAWSFEVDAPASESLELFYWLGKFELQPSSYSIVSQ